MSQPMSAMDEALQKGGLFLDDLTKTFRLIHPDNHQLSHDILTECEDYLQGTLKEKLYVWNTFAQLFD